MPDEHDEFEEAWARIVQDLTSTADTPAPEDSTPAADPPGPAAGEPPTGGGGPAADPAPEGADAGLAALFEPLRRARAGPDPEPAAAPGVDDPGGFVDNWEDEGHFVPPPPPEIPTGTPAKRLAWAGLLGGPITLALIALTGWDPPRVVSMAAGLVTLAGFATLVWLMPDSREDSGWDDGARI
jgi:hypothetical protein